MCCDIGSNCLGFLFFLNYVWVYYVPRWFLAFVICVVCSMFRYVSVIGRMYWRVIFDLRSIGYCVEWLCSRLVLGCWCNGLLIVLVLFCSFCCQHGNCFVDVYSSCCLFDFGLFFMVLE